MALIKHENLTEDKARGEEETNAACKTLHLVHRHIDTSTGNTMPTCQRKFGTTRSCLHRTGYKKYKSLEYKVPFNYVELELPGMN